MNSGYPKICDSPASCVHGVSLYTQPQGFYFISTTTHSFSFLSLLHQKGPNCLASGSSRQAMNFILIVIWQGTKMVTADTRYVSSGHEG